MIPDFQSIMLPLLMSIKDGKEYGISEVNIILSNFFKLTQDEFDTLLPSGTQKVFVNRVAWAKAHLKIAGLVESTKRGVFKISEKGSNFVNSNPKILNLKILKTLDSSNSPIIAAFNQQENIISSKSSTPEEIIDENYLLIRDNLKLELLEKILQCSPSFFENIVIQLLVKMGYGGTIADAGRTIGRSGDEGIDGIIKEDKLGLDIIYIQAKRWKGSVGRPEIQKFVGALAGQGAKKGVFITTSSFTQDAKSYQPKNETKIVLIDGEQLTELMLDYNLAVSTVRTIEIKRIDNDFFEL